MVGVGHFVSRGDGPGPSIELIADIKDMAFEEPSRVSVDSNQRLGANPQLAQVVLENVGRDPTYGRGR